MKFRTQYTNDVRPKTCAGSYLRKTYALAYNDRGCQCLEYVGDVDQYKEIQSHRESTDLSMILSRLDPAQVNGMMHTYDFDNILHGDVVDVFNFPKNPGEMLNLTKKGEHLFKGLPTDIQEVFNFSPHKFISSFGSKEFMDKINEVYHRRNPHIEDDAIEMKRGKLKPVEREVLNDGKE